MQMCSENQFPKEIVLHLDKNRTYFGTINVLKRFLHSYTTSGPQHGGNKKAEEIR